MDSLVALSLQKIFVFIVLFIKCQFTFISVISFSSYFKLSKCRSNATTYIGDFVFYYQQFRAGKKSMTAS